MAGKVDINKEHCKGCGLCVAACPHTCLGISDLANSKGFFPSTVVDTGCTGCRMCAITCPDLVITVYRDVPKVVEINVSKGPIKPVLTRESS